MEANHTAKAFQRHGNGRQAQLHSDARPCLLPPVKKALNCHDPEPIDPCHARVARLS